MLGGLVLGVVISLTLLLESQLVPVMSAWETPYRPGLIGSPRPGLQGAALNKERTLLSAFSILYYSFEEQTWRAKEKCVKTFGLHLRCVLMLNAHIWSFATYLKEIVHSEMKNKSVWLSSCGTQKRIFKNKYVQNKYVRF